MHSIYLHQANQRRTIAITESEIRITASSKRCGETSSSREHVVILYDGFSGQTSECRYPDDGSGEACEVSRDGMLSHGQLLDTRVRQSRQDETAMR